MQDDIFRVRRNRTKLRAVERECVHCGKPIKNLRPDSVKTAHSWCRPAAEPLPWLQSSLASYGTSSTTSIEADLPIEPETEAPMGKAVQKGKVLEIGVKPSLDQIHQIASEYKMYKLEEERIAVELAKRADFLKKSLIELPGKRVQIDGQELGVVSANYESFDLESAKKVKGLAPLLKPYTQKIEKFDLKAARKHIDEASLRKFITSRETLSLRFLKTGTKVDHE